MRLAVAFEATVAFTRIASLRDRMRFSIAADAARFSRVRSVA